MLSSNSEGLQRVQDLALRDKNLVFNNLLHHADLELFRFAFKQLRKGASPGVDQKTWEEYKGGSSKEDREEFDSKLANLRERVFNGSYMPLPVRRVHIPKPDGNKTRPLGILAIEDKIVQMVVRLLIEPLFESIFAGFSYGFRPNRGCHDALDALYMCITRGKVSWILDADIKAYFDSIPHDKLIECVKHRLSDPRIITLIARWLKCGIMEGSELYDSTTGTPQGGIISPLLANIYLHYMLDTFTHEWRNTQSRGDVYIVRYADDFLVMFQYKGDAQAYLAKLKWQFGRCGLELQTEKTRLIEFGRFAAQNRKDRGQGKPDTFDFLGFTHICSKTLTGKFKLLRITIGKRLGRKLQEYKQNLKKMMHADINDIIDSLNRSLQGYYNYFAIHDNLCSLNILRYQVIRALYKTLRRRSEKARSTVTWAWMNTIVAPFILQPHVTHAYPSERFRPNVKAFG